MFVLMILIRDDNGSESARIIHTPILIRIIVRLCFRSTSTRSRIIWTPILPQLGGSRMRSRIIFNLNHCDIVLMNLKCTKLTKYIFQIKFNKNICTLNSSLTREIVLLLQFNKIFSLFNLAYFISLDLIFRILID